MNLEDIDPETAKEWMDAGELHFIDVREQVEYDLESIPNAELASLSKFHPEEVKDVEGKKMVFYCAAGVRSSRAARSWLSAGMGEKAYNLKGGINDWAKLGLPIVRSAQKEKRALSRVYFFLGSIVLVFALFSIVLTPLFAIGNLFLGFLLLLSAWKGDALLQLLFGKRQTGR